MAKKESSTESENQKAKGNNPSPVPRIKEMYRDRVIPAMMKEFSYKNTMQVPRLERIVLNVGMGEALPNVKLLEGAVSELTQVTGQKYVAQRIVYISEQQQELKILNLSVV